MSYVKLKVGLAGHRKKWEVFQANMIGQGKAWKLKRTY